MLQQAYEFLRKDPTLKNLAEACNIPEIQVSTYPMANHLIKSIISQQLSTKAAATIHGRFTTLFDNDDIDLHKLNTLDNEILRAVGLSYNKVKYVKNVASYFTKTPIPAVDWDSMDDASLITELTKIKGVGIWTVQMILIFKLNRPDVMPIDDLIVRKGLMQILNISESTKGYKSDLLERSRTWQPYRSYVARMIWKAKELKLLNI